MKVFLTGSDSFVGAEVLRLCDDRGIEVVGIDITDPTRSDCLKADIRDRAVADLIPEGVDAILHLAALSRDPDCRDRGYDTIDINVLGTHNLIDAAQARRAKQFVFASTEWVYDSFDPAGEKTEDAPIDAARLESEYAFSKLTSEINLRQKYNHGFCPTTVLRFGIIYGPRRENWSAVEAILNQVATRDEVKVGALATGRCFIHVRDIARGILASVGCPGFEVINLQAPRFVSLGEVIAAARQATGRDPVVTEGNPSAPSIRRVSANKAKDLLGFEAEIGIGDGVREVAEYLGLAAA